MSSSLYPSALLLALSGLLAELLSTLYSLSACFSTSIISRVSMSQNVSNPFDFLAFFCFLVVGIENIRAVKFEFLQVGKLNFGLIPSQLEFTKLCLTQVSDEYLYPVRHDIHILLIHTTSHDT